MDKEIEKSIEKTYKTIQESISQDISIDSLEVVKQVEEYRQFWKPEKINVILLAESHVYTDKQDYEIKLKRSILHKIDKSILQNYPLQFVRFVYCLASGENELLTRKPEKNVRPSQFWKIFSSCVAESEDDLGFNKVLKKGTRDLLRRLRNKVDFLLKMKEKGVWLLDASIVGLYNPYSGKKPPFNVRKRIIEICWENHIASIIEEANPKHIIVIGKGVYKILKQKFEDLDIPSPTVLPQPQGVRGSYEKYYKKYQKICAQYC